MRGRSHDLTPIWVTILVAVITSTGGAIAGAGLKQLDRLGRLGGLADRLDRVDEENRKRDEHARLVDDALKALLFDKIARLHADTVERGRPVPTPVKTRVDAAYEAYAALGGNGVGRHYRDEMIAAHAADPHG